MRLTRLFLTAVLAIAIYAQAAPTINITGTVKTSKGTPVPQATVSLLSDPAITDSTDANGAFTLSSTSIRVNQTRRTAQGINNIGIQGNRLRFFIPAPATNGSIALFSGNGKRVVAIQLPAMSTGLQTLTLPELAPGFYVLHITIDQSAASCKLIASAGNKIFVSGNRAQTVASSRSYSIAAVTASVDTLVVMKSGYDTVKKPLDSYSQADVAIVMDSAKSNAECLFIRELGKTKEECDAKIENMVNIYFKNSINKPNGSKLYNDLGSEAYIEDVEFDDVRSEGQSYGMMIAVQLDMQDVFDKIWAWTKRNMKRSDGMFNWQRNTNGSAKGNDYAPDGEEYFLMDLLFAAKRWGDSKYQQDADALSNAMFSNGVFNRNLPVFVRGNATVDPSYIMPGFYTLISKFCGNHNSDWANIANAGRKHLAGCVSTTTGLMVGSPTTNIPFDWDAWRTVQNVELDLWISDLYFDGKASEDYGDWRGTTSSTDKSFATNWYNTYLGFFDSKREGKGYWPLWSIDGNSKFGDNTQNKTGLRPGLAAMNAYAANRATAKASDGTLLSVKFAKDLWDMEPPTDDQYIYYDGLLYMLGMLHATGNFQVFGHEDL